MYDMYMCVLVYSLLHICDSMAGHREGMRTVQWLGTCREGMRTVQWLGTEKACILYNDWAHAVHYITHYMYNVTMIH